MAKRIIHECDLTKQEFDPEEGEVFVVSIKKKGKKGRGPTFEVCPDAAEKLLNQLNGRNELPVSWSFLPTIAHMDKVLPEPEEEAFEVDPIQTKKRLLKEQGALREEKRPTPKTIDEQSGEKCIHMNKGHVQMTIRDGERFAYRICRSCHRQIPEKRLGDKSSYTNAKAPTGTTVRSIDDRE